MWDLDLISIVGGQLLLLDSVLTDDRVSPVASVMWDMLMLAHDHGTVRSGKQFQEMLNAAGFKDIKFALTHGGCSYHLICATKA